LVSDRKHPQILLSHHEEALHSGVLNQKHIPSRLVALDELAPVSSKVDEEKVLLQRSVSLPWQAERLTNPAMRAISSQQVIGAHDLCSSGGTVLEGGRDCNVVLRERDEFCVIPHIDAPSPRLGQQQWFESALRAIQNGWIWGKGSHIFKQLGRIEDLLLLA
jgi:hypothetical protein